jgi:uncharacterized protein YfiM (DUF2279 family)
LENNTIIIMKKSSLKYLVLFLICYTFLAGVIRADTPREVPIIGDTQQADTLQVSDKWIARDKLEHFGVSAFLSGVSYSVFRDFYNNDRKSSVCLSAGLTFSLGLGKELYDQKTPRGRFSYKDLVADVLGMGLGLWIATR